MKLIAVFIAMAMILMTIEGCDSRTAYDTRDVMSALEGGLMRANQVLIEGFADRPAQIITIDYKPATSGGTTPIVYKPVASKQ